MANPPVIGQSADGDVPGVLGENTAVDGRGVVGNGTGSNGVGVFGSGDGVGVRAESTGGGVAIFCDMRVK